MKTGFSVLRFGLQRLEDGSCTQNVQQCGEFESVERAFSTARQEAIREWQEACETQAVKTPKIRKIEIKDTEWGYDLKHDHLVVTRFWVHDGRPAEIAGM
jgi:hypothetical protein